MSSLFFSEGCHQFGSAFKRVNRVSNSRKILFQSLAICLLCFTLFASLSSCQQAASADTAASIEGTWKNYEYGYSSYWKIDGTSLTNKGGAGDVSYDDSSSSYAGNNLSIQKSSDSAGIIFIKYTMAITSSGTYSSNSSAAPDVGKWYAISYKDLTSTSVKLSGAYKANGATSTTTLDQAKTEFTIDNGYFSFYSECAKQ